MKTRLAILVTVAVSFSAWAQDGPKGETGSQGWTPELALDVKRVTDVRVSPDGTRVAFVVGEAVMDEERSEWVNQIHVGTTDGTSSFQLTRGETSSHSPRWSPDGSRIAFLTSRGGSSDVWTIPLDGGEARPLTKEKGNVGSFAWSPDGSQVAFVMAGPPTEDEERREKEKRDARVVDEEFHRNGLYIVSVEGDDERSPRRLSSPDVHVGGSFGNSELSFSPDGKTIAFAHTPTPRVNDWPLSDIAVVDVASAEVRELAATGASEMEPHISPDGKWVAYRVSDDPPTWAFESRVFVVPIEGGTPRHLAETHDAQPTIVGWSDDSSRVYVSETHRTVSRLSSLPVDGSAPVDVSASDVMVDGANLNRTRSHFGFTSQSFDRPVDAYVSKVASFAPEKVSSVQSLPELPLGETKIIGWDSKDGTPVEGLLTYPAGYREGTRVPLLVIVHGGPTGVFERTFIANRGAYPIAAFADRGYAVLRCNVRGSSGYGRDFRYQNYGDWGGGDYEDIMSGVDEVIAMGVADPDRLGIMGWSYGGYMTSWVITQTNRFKAASVGAGVTNLMSFTGTSDVPGFIPDYFSGEFWEVFDDWRAHSAMFHVGNVTTPTLIQHGEEDARVPISQGYELYNALVRQEVPTKMIVYPRQPHGIQEPKLQLDAMERNLAWFEQWIPVTKGSTTEQD